MIKESKTDAAQAGKATASEDLSRAIEASMEKEPGEEVRSVRLYDDNYRCNWWAWDTSPGPAYLNTGTITRSKFLRATMTNEKLVIEDLSRRA